MNKNQGGLGIKDLLNLEQSLHPKATMASLLMVDLVTWFIKVILKGSIHK